MRAEQPVPAGGRGIVRQWSLVVGYLKVNCYILAAQESDQALVIDPGDEAESILELVRGHGLKVGAVALTHCHWDHIGAVADVAEPDGAPVYLHEGDMHFLRDWSPRPVEPAGFLRHGDVVEAGGVRLSVRFTPGHSPGGICLVGENRVFSGDVLFKGSIGRHDYPGGSQEQLMASLRDQVLTLPDALAVYPGHGPASTIGEERRGNPYLTGIT